MLPHPKITVVYNYKLRDQGPKPDRISGRYPVRDFGLFLLLVYWHQLVFIIESTTKNPTLINVGFPVGFWDLQLSTTIELIMLQSGRDGITHV